MSANRMTENQIKKEVARLSRPTRGIPYATQLRREKQVARLKAELLQRPKTIQIEVRQVSDQTDYTFFWGMMCVVPF